MRKLIIFGASGHARVIVDAARAGGEFLILGFIDKNRPRGDLVNDVEVIGDESVLPSLTLGNPEVQAIIGIGDNKIRERVAKKVGKIKFASVVHPAAVVAAGVRVGEGVFIAASATVNCNTKIGAQAVVNTSACIDHDCDLGDFSFVSPGAVLAGGVRLGDGAFIGAGATIIPMVEIGKGAVVGAGATVIESVADGVTVVGIPARSVRLPEPAD